MDDYLMHWKYTSKEFVNGKWRYHYENEAYSSNCSYCTVAYDLRRKGYDVEAMPYEDKYYDDAGFLDAYEMYEDCDLDDMILDEGYEETIYNALEEMPDGSYGHFLVLWKDVNGNPSGGHSMIWEKTNDKVLIRDCQTNKTYTYNEWFNAYLMTGYAYRIGLLRTDNLTPNDKALRAVRNRRE